MISDLEREWKDLIPADFSPNSRVWIYQCSRMLRMTEALQAESILNDFVANWLSHGSKVKGYANLLFGQFVIIMADEAATGVSGCSTDSSVRVVKELETIFGVSFFERTILAFLINNKVELLPLTHFEFAIQSGKINPDTLYFNNLVQTREQLLEYWIIPLKHSWLKSRIIRAV